VNKESKEYRSPPIPISFPFTQNLLLKNKKTPVFNVIIKNKYNYFKKYFSYKKQSFLRVNFLTFQILALVKIKIRINSRKTTIV
jgi:hypothetical protein